MSSTTGLSSNTSNNQPRNALQLDASARDSILARNQARVLSALGVTAKDEFNSGGGLNPLKGLYSAAAATFLKNKQSQQGAGQTKGTGSFEKAADILKQLASKSSGSSGSGSTFSSNVSGPASGANYKKYQWTGNPGPTGSDVIVEPAPVEETNPVEAVAAPVDMSQVMTVLAKTIEDGGGVVNDRGDGTNEFKVLDIAGTIGQKGDKLVGSVTAESGTYSFEIAADGGVVLDASKGNSTSAEFDQLKHLLSGSLDGAKRTSAATPKPADPAAEVPEKPAEEPAAAVAVPAQTPEELAAADQAAAAAATTSSSSGVVSSLLTTSTSALLSLTGSGKSTDLGRYNAKLLVSDLQAAGGAATQKDANTLDIKLNGQAGTLTIKDDRVYGTLGTGKGQIQFEIRGNGEVKIDGDGFNSTARSNSINLRKAIGASTLLGGTDFDARVVKFNRYGTGTGLNLLG